MNQVIGLDTNVLIGLLEGQPWARSLLRASAGEELATTELNLFELDAVARRIGRPGREKRVATAERLRRALSVIPIDDRVAKKAAEFAAAAPRVDPTTDLILAAMEVNGCSEWVTRRGLAVPRSGLHVKVRFI